MKKKAYSHITITVLVALTTLAAVCDVVKGNGYDNFTIIVLPDTQNYVRQGYQEIFTNQTQWIMNNKDTLNIKFVMHEGDIVYHWNNGTQWGYANTSMSILDDNDIPYSVVPGNHDHENYHTDGSTYYYNQYFPVSRFSSEPWWGGNYSQNDNNYQLMTIGGDDYIFLSLDYCPSNDEIVWANDTLTDHSDRKAILTTHAYLNDTGARTAGGCADTRYIWDDLIRHHENLQIVLCGHMHTDDGEANRTDNNLAGKPVHQMLADYQDYGQGGDGWLRILEFAPAEDKIYVRTYSPYLNQYGSEFVLDYEMTSGPPASTGGAPGFEPGLFAIIFAALIAGLLLQKPRTKHIY